MAWLVYIALLYGTVRLMDTLFFRPLPANYMPLDLPPIRIFSPEKEGEDLEQIKARYIPTLTPVYLPPALKIAFKWPVQFTRTIRLTKGLTVQSIDKVAWLVRNNFHKTRIYREGDYILFDIPLVYIPMPSLQGV